MMRGLSLLPAERNAPTSSPQLPAAASQPSLELLIERYLTQLEVRHYSSETILLRRKYLRYFLAWCEDRELAMPREVTRAVLQRYQAWLYRYRKAKGSAPLSISSQRERLGVLRSFFHWMVKAGAIGCNPMADIDLPRLPERLPRGVLTKEEVEQVLAQPKLRFPRGVRDRAILEVLYSTGLRRMEIVHLTLSDIDLERHTLTVREGKGRKDRVVPIGERALAWLMKYVDEVRPRYVRLPDDGTVFLTQGRIAFHPNHLGDIVRNYIEAAGISKPGRCHLLRHTVATLMLDNGADVRHVQELLGHRSLQTTQVYTHVSIKKLKEVHSRTHPGAKLTRSAERKAATLTEDDDRGEGAARD